MLQAPANNSSAVSLQPNSLYIATQTILVPNTDASSDITIERGAWHWSFFFSDSVGRVTQLHWNVSTVEGNNGEYFVQRPLAKVLARTGRSVYVSFIRLSGWTSPGLEALTVTLNALYKEHEGKPSALLRSMSPLRSCRTWVLDAVAIFVANGWTTAPVDLEGTVKKESKIATDLYVGIVDAWNKDVNKFKPIVKDI